MYDEYVEAVMTQLLYFDITFYKMDIEKLVQHLDASVVMVATMEK